LVGSGRAGQAANMKIITTRKPSPDQLEQIRQLWNMEFPVVIGHPHMESFMTYLSKLTDIRYILVTDDDGQVLGWYMDFYRDKERWFVIAIGKAAQGRGFGKNLLKMGLEAHPEINGWVVGSSVYEKADGTLYRSPLPFYIKQGVRVFPDITFEAKGIKSIKVKLIRT
jgi:hypothetical protein